MPHRTESTITIDATPSEVMAAISDFDSYPAWTRAVKEARVVERAPDGRASRVWFDLDAGAIKDRYTLDYTWTRDREVHWELVQAENLVKSLEGAYLLADNRDGTTAVTYQLAVDVTVPMIGMIKRRAEKVIVDTALTELKSKVEGR